MPSLSTLPAALVAAGLALTVAACGTTATKDVSSQLPSKTPSPSAPSSSAKVLPGWSRPTVQAIEAAMANSPDGSSLDARQVHCIAVALHDSDLSDQELTLFAARQVDDLTVADKAASNRVGYLMYECLLPHPTPTATP